MRRRLNTEGTEILFNGGDWSCLTTDVFKNVFPFKIKISAAV